MEDFLGLPKKEDYLREKKRRSISAGMRRKHRKRIAKARENERYKRRLAKRGISWAEKMWPGEKGKYKHARSKAKNLYQKYLQRLAYRLYGILPPPRSRHLDWEDYKVLMNLISWGYNPRTGQKDQNLPVVQKARWDLDYQDWKSLIDRLPKDQRNHFKVIRRDKDGPFSLENLALAPRK